MFDPNGLSGTQKAVALVGTVIVIAAALAYAEDVHKEHKKLKALEEYLETLGVLEVARHRLVAIMRDPEKTEDDFLDAIREEREFLRIVLDDQTSEN